MSPSPSSATRKNQHKKGLSSEKARSKTEEELVRIREETKSKILKKRRLLPELEHLLSDDSSRYLAATTVIRKLLSTGGSPVINVVVREGVVHRLVQFLNEGAFPLLQTEAAWALANIASGTSDHVQLIIQLGSIPRFVQLLRSTFADAREQAIWALANIAADSRHCRDLVLSAGTLDPLLAPWDGHPGLTMMRSIAWTLFNLCDGKPPPPFEQVKPALPVLGSLINSGDEEVLIHACSALSIISDCSSDNIQFVIGAGVCPRLLELLVHASPKVQVPTLKTVGNIVSGTDAQTQFVIDNQGLPPLCQILTGNWDESIKEEACWVIANITAGNSNQIQAVIEANIIPPLVSLLQHDEFKINKEAARAISYLISGGSDKQIQHLVHQGCIKLLCDLLTCSDPDIISLCLDGLESILESGEGNKELGIYQVNKYLCMIKECDGFNKITGLQTDINNEVNKQASGILAKYWNKKENEEEESNSIDSGADMDVKFKELSLS